MCTKHPQIHENYCGQCLWYGISKVQLLSLFPSTSKFSSFLCVSKTLLPRRGWNCNQLHFNHVKFLLALQTQTQLSEACQTGNCGFVCSSIGSVGYVVRTKPTDQGSIPPLWYVYTAHSLTEKSDVWANSFYSWNYFNSLYSKSLAELDQSKLNSCSQSALTPSPPRAWPSSFLQFTRSWQLFLWSHRTRPLSHEFLCTLPYRSPWQLSRELVSNSYYTRLPEPWYSTLLTLSYESWPIPQKCVYKIATNCLQNSEANTGNIIIPTTHPRSEVITISKYIAPTFKFCHAQHQHSLYMQLRALHMQSSH